MNFIGVQRHDVFFKNKLHAVGQGLQQSVRTHQVRPPSRLDVRHHFALQPRHIGDAGQQDEEDERNLHRRDDDQNGQIRKCAHEVSWLRPLNSAPNYTG